MKASFLSSIILLLFSPALTGQSAISSQSASYQNENIQFDFILGEIFTGEFTDNTTVLTNGFFQSRDTYYPLPNNCEVEVLNLPNHTNATTIFYNAAEQILSTAIIQKDVVIKYISGETITLSPGFHAQKESNFTAILVGCTPDFSSLAQPNIPIFTQSIKTLNSSPSYLKIFPNPSHEKIQVNFTIQEEATEAVLHIYNIHGQLIDNIELGNLTKGKYSKSINLIEFETGNYFISLNTSNNLITQPLIIIHK